jgi:hypothetical protein
MVIVVSGYEQGAIGCFGGMCLLGDMKVGMGGVGNGECAL